MSSTLNPVISSSDWAYSSTSSDSTRSARFNVCIGVGGEEGFATDVDEQADAAGGGCRLGLGQRQRLGSVDSNR
jgi:hypothetical protein